MSEEDHYDTPWEFLARPASIRLPSNHRHSVNQPVSLSPSQLVQSPSFSGQPLQINQSPCESRRFSLRDQKGRVQTSREQKTRETQRDFYRKREEETVLEKNVDRVEAEKRLEGRATGDYLLRSRGDDGAALSLRGSTGILHIKLERIGDKWVVGQGPSFRTIGAAIHYYRRHPLPIKGADHLILKQVVAQHIQL